MSAAGHEEEDDRDRDGDPGDAAGTDAHAAVDPERAASALREAGFVRLVATADGDALAATGLLARALAACDVPYQASFAAVPETPETDGDCTVAVGHQGGHVTLGKAPLSITAASVARALTGESAGDGHVADPVLALAGAACAGVEPRPDDHEGDDERQRVLIEAADLERRPGVALPTADPLEGLVGSTLVHAAFSGDETAAAEALDGLANPVDGAAVDPDTGRRLASLVALSAVRDAPPRAAEAVERGLHPRVCDRFETVGGFADVLDAVARERPGTGVALALDGDVEAAALSAWRTHGERVHGALRSADTARYDGVYAARVPDAAFASERPRATEDAANRDVDPARLGTVARLLLAYRSPEPIALVVADGAAAVAADAGAASAAGAAFRGAARALGGRAVGREHRGVATFAGTATVDGQAADYVAAFRRALDR